MKVCIPKNFPIETYIKIMWASKRADKIDNLKDTVYVILNELTKGEKALLRWNDPLDISSKTMEVICGKNYYDAKRDMESNNDIRCVKSHLVGISNKGYILNFKYCMSELIEVELSSNKISALYQNYLSGGTFKKYKHRYYNAGEKPHLDKQFKNLIVELDPKIYDYKNLYTQEIVAKIQETRNERLKYLLYSKIGFLLESIERIKKNEHNPTISETNYRYNSIFTSIMKEVRHFIRINGNELIEFDLSASHIYVLATILNKEFFEETTTKEYSLINIYPQLKVITQMMEEAGKNYESKQTTARRAARQRKAPYLSVSYFDKDDLKTFRSLPFEAGFYELVDGLLKESENLKIQALSKMLDRNKIKARMMYFLSDPDLKRRERNSIVKAMKVLFPSVNEFIESIIYFKNLPSASPFLLQRCEAHLVLDIVGNVLVNKYPNSRIFTIHDCFLIEDSNVNSIEIIDTIKETLLKYTGIKPGVAIKRSTPFSSISKKIEEDYADCRINAHKKEDFNLKPEDRVFNESTINRVLTGIQAIHKANEYFVEVDAFRSYLNSTYLD